METLLADKYGYGAKVIFQRLREKDRDTTVLAPQIVWDEGIITSQEVGGGEYRKVNPVDHPPHGYLKLASSGLRDRGNHRRKTAYIKERSTSVSRLREFLEKNKDIFDFHTRGMTKPRAQYEIVGSTLKVRVAPDDIGKWRPMQTNLQKSLAEGSVEVAVLEK